jgi:hypothetical protein
MVMDDRDNWTFPSGRRKGLLSRNVFEHGEMAIRIGAVAILLAVVLVSCAYAMRSEEREADHPLTTSALAEVPDEFTLTYSYEMLNLDGLHLQDCVFEVSSNGSAMVNATTYFNPGVLDPEFVHESAVTLGDDLVMYLVDALEADDAWGLTGTYSDAFWVGKARDSRTETLTLEDDSGAHRLEFVGRAMYGVMPHTTVALGKLMKATYTPGFDSLAQEVQVDASIDQHGMVTVSAAAVNGASDDLTLAGVCEESWPAYIVRYNGCTVAELVDSGYPTCIIPIAPGETYGFETKGWNATGSAAGRYVVMAELSMFYTGFAVIDIEYDLGHVNGPPVGVYLSVEEKDAAEDTYVFDLSRSCDFEDSPTDLMVRWDWYDDGIWDTEWSHDKVAEHTFENISGYSVAFEIIDTEGAVSAGSASQTTSSETVISFSPASAAIGVGIVLAVVLVGLYLVRRGKGERSR